MSLSERSRSAAYHGLTSIIDDEEAVEEMLSYFPARDVEEPVTQEFLRAELGGVRLEIAVLRSEMATRSDFELFRSEMRVEFGDFRSEMRAEFEAFRSEMRDEFGEFTSEMRGELGVLRSKVDSDVQGLRSEMRTEFLDVRSQLDALHRDVTQSQADMRRLTQWMIGLVISVATLVVAVLAVAVAVV